MSWRVGVELSCLLSVALPADGGQVEEAFEALYGQEIQKVRRTRATDDDLALARRMMKDASGAAKQPALLVLICKAAYDLAARAPDGSETAVAAMEYLGQKVPERRIECLDKAVAVREQGYRRTRGPNLLVAADNLMDAYLAAAQAKADAGDYSRARLLHGKALSVATRMRSARAKDIRALIERLKIRQRLEQELKRLKARLRANPKDATARARLVTIHLVEHDDPSAALKVLGDGEGVDKKLAGNVRLAAGKPDATSEAACLGLAEWYRRLGDSRATSPASRAKMFKRAIRYYDTFLKRYTAKDLLRTRAELGRRKVAAALAAMPAAEDLAAGGWIDLLAMANVEEDATGKTWTREGSRVVYNGKDAYPGVMAPVAPRGDYGVQLAFILPPRQRENPRRGVGLVLPAGDGCVWLGVRTQGAALWGAGRTLIENTKCRLSLNRPHLLEVRVQEDKGVVAVTAALDGQRAIEFRGRLSPAYPPRPFGDWRCVGLEAAGDIILMTARLKMFKGTVELVRGPDGKSPRTAEIAGLVKIPPDRAVDVLKAIVPRRDRLRGYCRRRGADVELTTDEKSPGQRARLRLPVRPEGSYRMTIGFTRFKNENVSVFFPAGGKRLVANIRGKSPDQTMCIVYPLDLKSIWESPCRTGRLDVADGKPHTLVIECRTKGKEIRLSVSLDKTHLPPWQGRPPGVGAAVTVPRPDQGCPVFSIYSGRILLHSVKVQKLPDEPDK